MQRLRKMAGPVDTVVAGRTDAGVHASHQVVSFSTEVSLDPERVVRSLNTMLSDEIAIHSCVIVPDIVQRPIRRHPASLRVPNSQPTCPRPFSARSPIGMCRSPLTDRPCSEPPVISSGGTTSPPSVGRRPAERRNEPSTLRVGPCTARSSRFDDLRVAFCHQMVRSIVDTCVEVGKGKLGADEIPRILHSTRPQRGAPWCRPACWPESGGGGVFGRPSRDAGRARLIGSTSIVGGAPCRKPSRTSCRKTGPSPRARSFALGPTLRRESTSEAEADYLAFWQQQALERISWFKEPTVVLDDSNPPFYKWFTDGELNLAYNCLDRHLDSQGDKVAYHWIGEPGDTRTFTYRELAEEVGRFANVLKELGVARGDRVAIYMGMIPELPIAMLACARIGAVHSVVFGGFSSDALADRIIDGQAKVVVTQDGAWRGGKVVPLKANADVAIGRCPSIEHAVVVRRTENDVAMVEGRDLWWHDVVDGVSTECPPEVMGAEDMLYILYTSGTTGKAQGHRAHPGRLPDRHHDHARLRVRSQAGRRVLVRRRHRLGDRAQLHRVRAAGQRRHRRDVRGCAEPPGLRPLVVHHRRVRGVDLLHGSDGHPGLHEVGRRVSGPPRPLVAAAAGHGRRADQPRSLDVVPGAHRTGRLPDRRHVVADGDRRDHDLAAAGGGRHQTGFGHACLSRESPPTSWTTTATRFHSGVAGFLVLQRPWPSMLRTVYGDDQRYIDTYWSRFPGVYFPGDGCKRDEDGYFWLLGRVDDVMLVSGHNISTTEVESALVSHPAVAEAAVVGRKDEITGQAIAAFVTLAGMGGGR